MQAHGGRSPSQHTRWAPVPSSMGKPYRALAGPLDFPHPWYMLQAQALDVSPPSPACSCLSGQVWGECVQAPWLPRISDGTERMARVRRAGAILSVPRRKSEKAELPRSASSWDGATRATSSVLVSPHGGVVRALLAASPEEHFLLKRRCDASRPPPITTSPRAASSPGDPTPDSRSEMITQGLYQSTSGTDRAITTPIVICSMSGALCHHLGLETHVR